MSTWYLIFARSCVAMSVTQRYFGTHPVLPRNDRALQLLVLTHSQLPASILDLVWHSLTVLETR